MPGKSPSPIAPSLRRTNGRWKTPASIVSTPTAPRWPNPSNLVKRMSNDDPENMSRSEIADVVRSGQLTQNEVRKYVTTYQEKLARPFACFVFILIAIPLGLRSIRSSGSTSFGFGLSLAIVFVYYVVMTICSFAGEAFLAYAPVWAWMPNLLFTAIGLVRLRRAALV